MMERDQIEALTQIIILRARADDEVAHLLSKMLDHDNAQRAALAGKDAEIARLKQQAEVSLKRLIAYDEAVIRNAQLQSELDRVVGEAVAMAVGIEKVCKYDLPGCAATLRRFIYEDPSVESWRARQGKETA